MRAEAFKNAVIEVTDFPDTGRGCKALVDIDTHQPIVDVPYQSMITATGRAFPDIKAILPSFQTNHKEIVKEDLLELEWIVCWFAILKTCFHSSPHSEPWQTVSKTSAFSSFESYYHILPTSFDTMACHFTNDLYNVLPLDIQQNVARQREQRALNIQHIQDYMGSILSKQDLEWAWDTVNTRCISLSSCPTYHPFLLKNTKKSLDTIAVIPLLDCLNHTSTARCRMQFQFQPHPFECRSFQLFVCNKVSQHDQVFIHYGHHDNHFLLVEYGFIETNNPYNIVNLDAVAIKVMQEYNPKEWHQVKSRLELWNMWKDYVVVQDACEEEPVLRLLNAVRLCVCYSMTSNVELNTRLEQWEAVYYGQASSLPCSQEQLALNLYIKIIQQQGLDIQERLNQLACLQCSHQRDMVQQILLQDKQMMDRHERCVKV